jgi:protein-L-isoaspartate(D-aspartate) O-methyltransferase
MGQGMDIEQAVPENTGASAHAQTTMQFLLRLRERGISQIGVLRALETIPREHFVPHRHADLAWRDIALPIACGQTMPEPYLVARLVEALNAQPAHRVLEIGAGNGYSAAILSKIAQEVVTIERFKALADAAAMRLQALHLDNVKVLVGDGLALEDDIGLFDRILVQGVVSDVPEGLVLRLAENGVIVFAQAGAAKGAATVMRLTHGADGFHREKVFACRMQPLIPGVSAA